jgi:hypothetical protein
MKRNFLILVLLFFVLSVRAQENINQPTGNPSVTMAIPAGCGPSTSITDLDIGNVRAPIFISGDMWWDLIGNARYEVPKNSGKYSLYAGALWIGGKVSTGNLVVAAQTYRQSGVDFWPGPIDNQPVDSNCLHYDRHWKITRQEVSDFITSGTLTPDIQDWPGMGINNQSHALAPFVDVNGDGLYNVSDGDYPSYDFSGSPNCCDNLHGDQTLWWVFNDAANIHASNGAALDVEIQAQAFAFNSGITNLDNATFYQYKIINRSTVRIDSTYFGQWVDPGLGNSSDDYLACDVGRGMGYCYNGDNYDDLPDGYGFDPPAVGIDILQGPEADVGDEIDNDRDGCLDCTFHLNTVTGLIDTIPDSVLPENIIMSKFICYNNDASVIGNPVNAVAYYNYLHGIWKDGNRMTYGGDGHSSGPGGSSVPADFMFPGISDPTGWGTNHIPQPPWDEITAGNNPGAGRRFLMSAGPFTLMPGAVKCVTTAVVWARATSGGPNASVALLQQADDEIQQYFNSCFSIYPTSVNDVSAISNSINVFPNPFHDYTIINLPFVKHETFEITVYDLLGTVVRNYKNIAPGNFIIKREQLSSGTYLYKISKDGNKIKSGKLIVMD